jgi:hypothetical protein
MTQPYYSDALVTLYHGDCREITEWLAAEVLVTDPPYGDSYTSNKPGVHRGKVIANDDSERTRDDALALWGNRRPSLVFGSWKSTPPEGTKTALVWDKGLGAGMGDLSVPWKPNWELIYVIGAGFHGHRGTSIITGRMVTWASKGRDHPNQKPTGLILKLLDKCPPGAISDPFAGSGSTLVAAKQLGRRSVGVEIEECYCELIARRLDQGVLPFGEAS